MAPVVLLLVKHRSYAYPMFKNIPTIKPHSQTASQAPIPNEPPNPDAPNQNTGKRVWMMRVADENALKRLVAFVALDDDITDLKPRYPYDAEKQRRYRARKKAKDEALMQRVSRYERDL